MAKTGSTKKVAKELLPLLRVYEDGAVERLVDPGIVPPSNPDPETGVLSKDVTISQNPEISARIYLPKAALDQASKLPVLVYFHGGGFCNYSAFSLLAHTHLNILVSQAKVVAVSVEYRLAPEHPLPAAYDDSWSSLQWVCSHKSSLQTEPWLTSYGDFDRVFLGGDSCGGNIVHSIALKAGSEALNCEVKLHGAYLGHPYFWGSDPIKNEPVQDREKLLEHKVWELVYPNAEGGIDHPMINPFAANAPALSGLGCSKLLVCVAEKDPFRDRGLMYYEKVRESDWNGEVELFEVEGEEHSFHFFNHERENAKRTFKRLSDFLSLEV